MWRNNRVFHNRARNAVEYSRNPDFFQLSTSLACSLGFRSINQWFLKPTAVFWGKMYYQLLRKSERFLWPECFIWRRNRVSIQVIHGECAAFRVNGIIRERFDHSENAFTLKQDRATLESDLSGLGGLTGRQFLG